MSYQHYLLGQDGWRLRAQGASNQNGCTNKDKGREEFKDSLEECKIGCQNTRFLQYHTTRYCSCFKDCDFKKPASAYGSKVDVYEQQKIGKISSGMNSIVGNKIFLCTDSHIFMYIAADNFRIVNSANYCDKQSSSCKCASEDGACGSPRWCLAGSCIGKDYLHSFYDHPVQVDNKI